MPKDIHSQLKAIARKRGVSLSVLILTAVVDRWLPNGSKET